jgi:hypothetical protein
MPTLPPRRPRLAGAALFAPALAASVALAACGGGHPAPGPTEIQFGEVTNFGYACGGPLDHYTVSCRETQTAGTAGCQQPVLFTDLAPNATYTFDIQGFDASNNLCWQGSCSIVAEGGATTLADCSMNIQHLCNK